MVENIEKFNAQNPELEKVPSKKEFVNKSKPTLNSFKKTKSKIIDKPLLSDEEVKKIMHDFDNH